MFYVAVMGPLVIIASLFTIVYGGCTCLKNEGVMCTGTFSLVEVLHTRSSSKCVNYFPDGAPVLATSSQNSVCGLCDLSQTDMNVSITTTQCACIQSCCGFVTSDCCKGEIYTHLPLANDTYVCNEI